MWHPRGGRDHEQEKQKEREEQTQEGGGLTETAPTTLDLRTVEMPLRPNALKPAEIRAMRAAMNASQALFARLLNVSSNAVESWEQGIREPRQATLKLLHIARKNPSALLG